MTANRVLVQALVAGRVHDYRHLARPLLRSLELAHHFDLEMIDDPAALSFERGGVIMAASDSSLSPAEAENLTDFVKRGGGVILLGGTLAAWNGGGALGELASWTPSGPAPKTELVLRVDPTHPITERLGPELKLIDELYLSEGPPAEASVLVRTSWQFTEQVVAYERGLGAGRFVHIGLGHSASTYEDVSFQRLVHRSLRFAAGQRPAAPVGVGLVGYGAIGRDHAASIASVRGLRLGGVCDLSTERREEAKRELGVPVHATAAGLYDDPDIGLVVVGTPPVAHADAVLAALASGKDVVCEKPFALRVDEVDRMIDAAAACGRVLTVFQSRRWDPDFIALRDVVRSGGIGELFYMESFIGGFSHPCDFWHSHEPISGGTIYDWGSHYFDWILQLFPDPVRAVSANAHKRVWHDVTNSDQVRVDLTFANGAQASFLQSDIAATMKPKWYLLGTQGAVLGEWRDEPVPADFPARVKVFRPADGGGSHEENLALAPRDDHGFYRNLADHLAWGEPLAVTTAEARRTVAVMEAATRSIARGGAQVEVDI
ncbi:MAG TPA: Gfo/Idh/MocA family oxidoreductase [Candidatus Dormibacteraeota bacterium]